MRRKRVFHAIALAVVVAAWACTTPLVAGNLVLGTNWIVNGDAEAGAGSTDGSLVAVPGWTLGSPTATVVQYLSVPGSFPAISEAPAVHGNNFFAGGPGQQISALDQWVDVTAFATQIDQGLLTYARTLSEAPRQTGLGRGTVAGPGRFR
jgi:hypothetical protein